MNTYHIKSSFCVQFFCKIGQTFRLTYFHCDQIRSVIVHLDKTYDFDPIALIVKFNIDQKIISSSV